MKLLPYNESFLLRQFREFYGEVIRLKRLINSSAWVPPLEMVPGPHGISAQTENGTWVYYLEPERAVIRSREKGNPNSLALRGPTPFVIAEDFVRFDEGESFLRNLDAPVQVKQPPLSDDSKRSLFVWQSLLTLFRRHARQMPNSGGTTAESYLEAQYIMAAVADEVFIHLLEGEAREAWMSNLLESTLFKTRVAGEVFFDKLDQLLLLNRESADKDLAVIYLSALSLGFEGKYRGNDHGQLRRYRQELFAFAFQKQPDLLDESKIAFPDAYIENLKPGKKKKLTNPRIWLVLLGIVLLSYITISHGIWLGLTSRVEEANRQVVEIENRLNTIPVTKR